MHSVKTITLVLAAAVLVLLAILLLPFIKTGTSVAVNSYEECAAAGYPIMESYPEQCRTPDGRVFVNENAPIQYNKCVVAGCSGQLCVTEEEAANAVTTCEYKAEYACYRDAYCGPQADDTCGWTMTEDLRQCLENPPAIESNVEVIL